MIVAIANQNAAEIDQLRQCLDNEYEVLVVTPDVDIEGLGKRCDVLVLDAAFTPQNGLDFLTSLLTVTHLPVLMLAPADNQTCAVSALRAGAFNYLLKTGDYLQLVGLALSEAHKRFKEREEMKRSIDALKQRVAKHEDKPITKMSATPAKDGSPQVRRKRFLDEIAERLRRGEVNLPVYSPINTQFRDMLQTQAPFADIATLLGQDAGLTSKLIVVANSPYYRGAAEITTLKEALGRLGLKTAKNYVEMITNRALYTTSNPKYQSLLQELWEHTLACAYTAHALAVRVGMDNADDLFTMAILHDIGKLFLVQLASELEAEKIVDDELLPEDMEEFLHANHAQFGAALLKRWKLSDEFVRIARYHENPEAADPISKSLCVVCIADLLTKQMGYGKVRMAPEDSFAAKIVNVDEEIRNEVVGEVARLMQEVNVPT